MLTIYTSQGLIRFETPINVGSKRVLKLMGDDYVTLKFSVAKPIYFKLGDFVDVPGFGRFEYVKPYQPTYNKTTNGYDYELQLDAQYVKWRNKLMRFLPQIGGAECAWTLTSTAIGHMERILENVNALAAEILMDGEKVINQQYLYNGTTKWVFSVDDSVPAYAKTIDYDGTNIIDALTAIAEAFECEWWITDNVINLGKCEDSQEYIDLEMGVNVSEMSHSDSSEDYVTRILAFGSDRNISPRYRKDLIFDVKAIANGGNRISDTSRPLEVDWFDPSLTEVSASDSALKRATNISIDIIDDEGAVTSTLAGAIYNPDYQSGIVDRNWIELPDGAVMQIGQRFRIENIIEKKVKSSYFSSRYSAYSNLDNVVRNGIVTSRLMLPVSHGTPYVDYKPGMSMEEGVEDVVVFEGVFPQAVSTITSISTVERKETIENDDGSTTEKTFTAYKIKDDFFTSAHLFLKDYILPNETLKIAFRDGKRYKEGDSIPAGKKIGDLINPESGKLNGWTFEVQFTKDSDGSAIWEIVRDNESFIPDDILRPEIGDQFVLTGFDISAIDDLFTEKAEEELLESANKYIKKLNTDPSTYDCTMMPDVMKAGLTLILGSRVNLINEAYIESTIDDNGRKWGRKSRVIGYEIPLDLPYDNPVYTIGEKAAYSRFGQIEDSIDVLKFSMSAGRSYYGITTNGNSTSGDSLYVIKQTDITPASDTNVFSALRSCLEFASKKTKETIDYLWSFVKGIRIGNYVMNNDGAKIDANGDAEFGSVSVRKGMDIGGDVSVAGDAQVGKELTVNEGITIGNYYQPGAYGGRIWVDDLGKVHIETDYIEAREKIEAKEVEIQEETHVGGCQIISPAAMRCSRVLAVRNEANSVVAYKCFFTAEDENGTRIFNQFEEGDLARCETFNLAKRPNGKTGNHYFWRKVTEVGYVSKGDADYADDYGMEGYIILSNLPAEKDKASDAPMAGDRIIAVGNDDPTKADRSNLIILASYGSGSPYIYQYKGINTFALTKDNLKVAISPNGNLFTGKFVIENGSEEVDVMDYIENNIYLEAYQLVLSNEMAGVPSDKDGNVIGDLPSSKITIFKGKTIETGWMIKLEPIGCKASIVDDTLYLSELSAKNATITITATKADCPTLSKVMTICKLKEGETGMSGDHAVQFEIEPDKPMVLADMDGNCDPTSLGCKVYMVIGNQTRIEVPLANTAPITTYKAGDKLLFFNGKLFVSRPVEVGIPTDLILRYVIVNQDYVTDKTSGKVTPVITSESEHIYTGAAITTSARMKHIIFKLYRGKTLLDMQTVVVTTDPSAMKVVYDTRFEVNEKEILAHASRITQTEKNITELRITADGISANIGKQLGIIQDLINGAGRNLLLKTSQNTIWQYISDSEAVAIRYLMDENPNNATCFNIASRTDATYERFYYPIRPELIKESETYTFSIDLKNITSGDVDGLEFFVVIANKDISSPLTDVAYFDRLVTAEEAHLTIQLKATATGDKDGSQVLVFGIVPARINQWRNLQLWHPKLEKGSTPTYYTEAPEDREDYLYAELNAKIDLTAEGLRTEVSQKIGESEDRITSQYQSAISQKADEILTEVHAKDEELGESISQMRQTADNISLKVQELSGYQNIIPNGTTGIGWALSGDDGVFGVVAPNTGGSYSIINGTVSSKYLRTALFRLKANTKYTLSFKCTRLLSSVCKGTSFAIKYGDTKTILIQKAIPLLESVDNTDFEVTATFSTSDSTIYGAFVEFCNQGKCENAADTAVWSIKDVMLEVGEIAHPYVEDSTGLLATGIDIKNRRIVFTSDNIIFENNTGERSMFIDSTGKIYAKYINADELAVKRLVAGEEGGERVEITPEERAISIFDENGDICSVFSGQSHSGGATEIFSESAEGIINLTNVNADGLSLASGKIVLTANKSFALQSKTYNLYSAIWPSDAPTNTLSNVIFTAGTIYAHAYSTGYVENANNPDDESGFEAGDKEISQAMALISLSLEVADDASFTQGVRIYTIGGSEVSACASLTTEHEFSGEGGISYDFKEESTPLEQRILTGQEAKALKRGYCRIHMCVILQAQMEGSYAEVFWGEQAPSGVNLCAKWKNEFYVSNYFANGFCLGIRKDKYIAAYKDADNNMNFAMEEEQFGIKCNHSGIQIKHHNGLWMNLPMLLWKATLYYNTNNTYGIRNQKSFDGSIIPDNNVSRTAPSEGHIHVNVTFPDAWSVLKISTANTIVNAICIGNDLLKPTLVSLYGTGMTLELSDDNSANDGEVIIELFII